MARAKPALHQVETAAPVQDRAVPTEQLVPNPRNPRKHPEAQIDRLVVSLQTYGQTRPLLARRENLMLIAGHGVLAAAKRLGWTEIGVRLLDVDQATADRIMLGDNRFSDLSTADEDRVAELLREIDSSDWLSAGFSTEEADTLLNELDKSELTIREIDTKEVADEFWISVRGPLAQQAEVLERLKILLREFPTVQVEIGTVNDIAA